ncbi:primase-helicase family protein [Nonlabens sp. Hel1_33_55]|uniref:primase-helicase family protein n=1 Tax=Nonlabens sp. Hel1_33_55 TaxID=1336802 RepID=UPI000B82F971|nr:primase-helicase family protein [Nonlabens sp. Hel1_33_55]
MKNSKENHDERNWYARVGTDTFKFSQFPVGDNEFRTKIIRWSYQNIVNDHSKDFANGIPKYDGFIYEPDNIGLKKEIGDYLNEYSCLSHIPKEGDVTITLEFLKHIFGEQMELGLDYLQIMYLDPKHFLPVLCLVSKERNTGKSTFGKWIKDIYEDNALFIGVRDLASQFNGDWLNNLVLIIDETMISLQQVVETMKFLSTSYKAQSESKNKDRKSVNFYGKFIPISNHETTFIKIDQDETRFWVRKIPVLKEDDVNILKHLKKEIPHFLHYLTHRKLSTTRVGRMHFDPKELETQALVNLKRASRHPKLIELELFLIDLMDELGRDQLQFTLGDLYTITKEEIGETKSSLKDILLNHFNILPLQNSSNYDKIIKDPIGDFATIRKKGKFYTLNRKLVDK